MKLHGATVHFVTSQLDHGPIVMQAAVPVLADDNADTLAQRVLKVEHQIYPQAVRWFIQAQLNINQGLVQVQPPALQGRFAHD